MEVFITGGSGFIGGAVIARLVDRHRVRAMARSPVAAEIVSSLGARPVPSSLQSVSRGDVDGAEVVVHCAAYVAEWGRPEEYRVANVDGTARLLEAVRAAGVRRLVHISTESVLFTGGHLKDMDETWPYPKSSPFPYSETKRRAEQMVLAANGGGLETLVLRPVLVWGPGDRTILPEVTAMADTGRFVWLDGGRHGISPTHVENVAHAVDLALDRGRPGEVYFITDDERFSLKEFLSRYAATAGVTLPDRSLPGWAARWAAAVVEPVWRLTRPGVKPPLTRFGSCLLSREITVTSDKARRELGYRPVVTVEQGLRRLRETGRLSE